MSEDQFAYAAPRGNQTERRLESELSHYPGETPANIDRLVRNNNVPYLFALRCRLSARRNGNQQERASRL